MNFTSRARRAAAFDRAVNARRTRPGLSPYESELRLVAALDALDVRPDPAFTADLRSELVAAAAAAQITAPSRVVVARRRRRWSVAGTSAAVVFAVSGAAVATVAISSPGHPSSNSHPTISASAVDAATVGPSNAATTLAALQRNVATYARSLHAKHPGPTSSASASQVHSYASHGLSQLTQLQHRLPSSAQSQYASTLQTLQQIDQTAKTACPTCSFTSSLVPSPGARASLPTALPSLPQPNAILSPAVGAVTSPLAKASVPALPKVSLSPVTLP